MTCKALIIADQRLHRSPQLHMHATLSFSPTAPDTTEHHSVSVFKPYRLISIAKHATMHFVSARHQCPSSRTSWLVIWYSFGNHVASQLQLPMETTTNTAQRSSSI